MGRKKKEEEIAVVETTEAVEVEITDTETAETEAAPEAESESIPKPVIEDPFLEGRKMFGGIKDRHHKRKLVMRSMKQLRAPIILDADSVKEFNKTVKELQTELLYASHLEDFDMAVLLHAFTERCYQEETIMVQAIQEAKEKVKRLWAEHDQASYDELMRVENKEKEEENRKLRGGNEDQRTIFDEMAEGKVKDDGSTAEPASECVTKPLDEIEATEEVEPLVLAESGDE